MKKRKQKAITKKYKMYKYAGPYMDDDVDIFDASLGDCYVNVRDFDFKQSIKIEHTLSESFVGDEDDVRYLNQCIEDDKSVVFINESNTMFAQDYWFSDTMCDLYNNNMKDILIVFVD